MGIDESTNEVVAVELTENSVSDGAYDTSNCYNALDKRGAQANIPPRKNAVLAQHGNCKSPPLTRDENIRSSRKLGRKKWKQNIGYHRRSLSETAMFRIKQLFGAKLSARLFENQVTEAIIRCKALNKMTQLGMPVSEAI